MNKLVLLAFVIICSKISAQINSSIITDIHFTEKQKLYIPNNKIHTSIYPFISNNITDSIYNALSKITTDSSKSLTYRKIFSENLIEYKFESQKTFINFYPDFQVGRDINGKRNIYINTRGFELKSDILNNLFFSTLFYENQAKFPKYYEEKVKKNGIVPGQADMSAESSIIDWAYSKSILSYSPSNSLNILLAYDHQFIGDGYRSVILSDASSNYPFLRFTFSFEPFVYVSSISQILYPNNGIVNNLVGYERKWFLFHYLDWNITDDLTVGFFESITWADSHNSIKRGFDFTYLNPFLFLRPVDRKNASADNAIIAVNVKYNLSHKQNIYAQFLLDEFTVEELFSNSGYWANKYAFQFGLRGSEKYKSGNFNYLLEYNHVMPFTFSQVNPITNYGNYYQPLAHPTGANMNELLGYINYNFDNFNFLFKVNQINSGLDTASFNFGGDIYKSYQTRSFEYGNKILQGLKNNSLFIESSINYIINPVTNLRVEVGLLYNREKNKNSIKNNLTTFIGLRSSFRNLYFDY